MTVNLTLTVGQTETFNNIQFLDSNGFPITNETPTQLGISFVNSDPSIVSVSFDGVQIVTVTALKAGSASISGVANGVNLTNSLQVSVQSAGVVSINWGSGSPIVTN